ncbi:MAG TPA: hypothetical protein VEI95_18430, partial [Acidobacteriota bacterium]|nr:hypothetical protein [Acidobacteriota bacterium]
MNATNKERKIDSGWTQVSGGNMNDLRSFLANPFVTLVLIIAIGAIIGWIYEEQTHSPHGYITSALVGVAGAYTGFHLATLIKLASWAA